MEIYSRPSVILGLRVLSAACRVSYR